ncbi:hypothetical protein DXG03_008167 [Asterophora parasitica]|uniref:Uncharacterized protein n=1 Tax=Asterophora parasitica TaxID=117018 RepID=A0A9P7KBI7_9AGAR|nr:hypothetical protein DXG03_008167 [Asterophora parasitica]
MKCTISMPTMEELTALNLQKRFNRATGTSDSQIPSLTEREQQQQSQMVGLCQKDLEDVVIQARSQVLAVIETREREPPPSPSKSRLSHSPRSDLHKRSPTTSAGHLVKHAVEKRESHANVVQRKRAESSRDAPPVKSDADIRAPKRRRDPEFEGDGAHPAVPKPPKARRLSGDDHNPASHSHHQTSTSWVSIPNNSLKPPSSTSASGGVDSARSRLSPKQPLGARPAIYPPTDPVSKYLAIEWANLLSSSAYLIKNKKGSYSAVSTLKQTLHTIEENKGRLTKQWLKETKLVGEVREAAANEGYSPPIRRLAGEIVGFWQESNMV